MNQKSTNLMLELLVERSRDKNTGWHSSPLDSARGAPLVSARGTASEERHHNSPVGAEWQ